MKIKLLAIIMVIILLQNCDPSIPVAPSIVTETKSEDWLPKIEFSNNGNSVEVSIGNLCRQLGVDAPGEKGASMKADGFIEQSVESEIIQLYESQLILASFNNKSEFLEKIRNPYENYIKATNQLYKSLAALKYENDTVNIILSGISEKGMSEKELLLDVFNFPIWLSLNQTNEEDYMADILYFVDTSIVKYIEPLLKSSSINDFNSIIEKYEQDNKTYYSEVFRIANSIYNFCQSSYEVIKNFEFSPKPEKTYDLIEAEEMGMVSYASKADSTFRGRGMKIKINRKTSDDIALIIPAGMVFKSYGGIVKPIKSNSFSKYQLFQKNTFILETKNNEKLQSAYQPIANSSSIYIRFTNPGDSKARKLSANWKNLIYKKGLKSSGSDIFIGFEGDKFYRFFNSNDIDPELYQKLMAQLDRDVPITTDCEVYYTNIPMDGINYRIKYKNCIVYGDGTISNWVYRYTDITVVP